MRVSSKVIINRSVIRKLEKAQIRALEMTGESLHTEVIQAQVFPFMTGNLQNESTFVDDTNSRNGTVSLVSTTPYARRLYFHPEYHFDKTENPNAKGKWYEDWMEGGKHEKFAQNAFAQHYRRLTGV